ncbi:hypothetical protein HK104_007969, partial [Borealophlyctis nickersoniae]
MTLAVCRRMTDELVRDSLKKGTPGPGAYEIKAPIEAKLKEKRNRIHFGGSGGDRTKTAEYINPEQMRTPGPGAYYPEFAEIVKPPTVKSQPFASTTDRFDHSEEERSRAAPAPGSYEVDQIDSILQRVHKRIQLGTGVPNRAFGSISERFPRVKT